MSTPFHPAAGAALAWLATYLLHSTLLLGLAALVSRPLGRRSILAEEAVWRAALLGAVLTATLQLAAGREPLAGQWSIATAAPAAREAFQPLPVAAPAAAEPLRREALAAPAAVEPERAAAPARRPLSGAGLLLGLWAAGVLLAGLRLGGSWLRLRHSLRPRLEIVGGTMSRLLARLTGETGFGRAVRLTCSYRLPVPVALGTRRPEIAVPPRALSHLEPEQQESLLAHELAHLARRDPAWLVAVQILTSLLFFQPLNWLARRRLREISELLCDEWAVGQTGRPVTLARCLAEVAHWSVPGPTLPVPGMAGGSSQLARRVRRLVEGAGAPGGRRPRWLVPALGGLILAVAVLAPGFAVRAEQEPAVAGSAAEAVEPADPAEAAEPGEAAEPESPAEEAETDRAALAGERERRHRRARHQGDEDSWLTPEQREAIERLDREAERISLEVERSLRPQVESLERQMEGRMAEIELESGEMKKLEAEIDALVARVRPDTAEIERIAAEASKGAGKEPLSAAEREEIAREAKRLADSAKPSGAELAEIRRLADQHVKIARELMEKHRAEIAASADMAKQAEAIREQVRRELEPEIRALREQHRKLHERRREIRRERGEPEEPDADLDVDPEVDVDVDPDVHPVVAPKIEVDVHPEVAPAPEVREKPEPKLAEPPR